MGYRVDYLPVNKLRGIQKRRHQRAALCALAFLLFCVLVSAFWDRGSEVLRGILFSGDAAVTVSALESFARELGQGESAQRALLTFCRRVMEEGSC